MRSFTLSDFDYELPAEHIAQKPAEPRDHARLLVYRRSTGEITDAVFHQLGAFLHPGTTLVMNNSRVEKARLLFGNREVFITHTHNPHTVDAMVRPGRKFKLGREVQLTESIRAMVNHIEDDGLRRLTFNLPLDHPAFEPHRNTPFPPYIAPDESLAGRYQTVYAKPEGSKAAPTAGLHFTTKLLDELREAGHPTAEVTLHVGLGTFAPVKTDDISAHKLHTESWMVGPQAAEKLSAAKHITAVGTTTTRVLESLPDNGRRFSAGAGDTGIYIKPGYRFRHTDSMITNFHLPKSTLLMMIAAFAGYDEMRHIYAHAIQKNYRFYSFGDAMLLI
ncbi:S-adenosylmethionine--tRNA ribosyltransferase-isomerase [Cyclonatronum proteinivorum]|uniref:S-adenosylmethionine:tRNA ribosyltransferase-isomerase n=1 Tax=Cyclonatronum proteinivorum TaxID=1457365 RepID=A0A345UGC3_9BACT|nr:tRNA preQ1(34) S-adenosylmethionine ribosyltransferase-isomerase QueA [Cyclonatronum proteinivorum]AXI99524.1 S-adenosylmethionine--tRNA ribosyltransferase-isomerase [Cyclonatronum proteinivorum]